MVRFAKVTCFIFFFAAFSYVFLFLAIVPLVTDTKGMPKMLALNGYDFLYRPVRKELPYRNIVRKYWLKYERYWCDTNLTCEIYGDERQGGKLFGRD